MEKGAPNFIRIAESFGIKSIMVKTREELKVSVETALRYDGPILVDFHVIPDTNCYPMVAPGKSNSQMLGV
jgi:acetolactate synthase-1/2/3 large subunit